MKKIFFPLLVLSLFVPTLAAAGVLEAAEAASAAENFQIVVKRTRFIMEVPVPEDAPLTSVSDFTYHRDEKEIFAVDNLAAKIVVFSEEGERVREFGVRGDLEGQFGMPVGIAVDTAGNIVVTDITRRAILTFKPNGAFVREFKTDRKFKPEDTVEPLPVAVQVTKDGEYVITDNANSHLIKYDARGEIIGGWGELFEQTKRGLGYMAAPGGIQIDGRGRVLLQDYGFSRVQVFDAQGRGLFTIGESAQGLVGAFVKVGKPFVDEERKVIYGLDNAMGNIQAFDYETGRYLYTLTNENGDLAFNERADWDLSSTRAMARDSQGRYWIMMGLPRKFAVIQMIE